MDNPSDNPYVFDLHADSFTVTIGFSWLRFHFWAELLSTTHSGIRWKAGSPHNYVLYQKEEKEKKVSMIVASACGQSSFDELQFHVISHLIPGSHLTLPVTEAMPSKGPSGPWLFHLDNSYSIKALPEEFGDNFKKH